MTAPGDHPLPPPGGYTGALALTRIPKDRTWFRLYRHPYAPLHFGDHAEGAFRRGAGRVRRAVRGLDRLPAPSSRRWPEVVSRTISQERLQRYRVARDCRVAGRLPGGPDRQGPGADGRRRPSDRGCVPDRPALVERVLRTPRPTGWHPLRVTPRSRTATCRLLRPHRALLHGHLARSAARPPRR